MKVIYGSGRLDYRSPLCKMIPVSCVRVMCTSGPQPVSDVSGEDYEPETTDPEFHL